MKENVGESCEFWDKRILCQCAPIHSWSRPTETTSFQIMLIQKDWFKWNLPGQHDYHLMSWKLLPSRLHLQTLVIKPYSPFILEDNMWVEAAPTPGSHQVLRGVSHSLFPFPDPELRSVGCVLFQLQVLQHHAFQESPQSNAPMTIPLRIRISSNKYLLIAISID